MLSSTQREWQMDPSPHYFVAAYTMSNPAISESITKEMENYEKACALAKVKMYAGIYNILKKYNQIDF